MSPSRNFLGYLFKAHLPVSGTDSLWCRMGSRRVNSTVQVAAYHTPKNHCLRSRSRATSSVGPSPAQPASTAPSFPLRELAFQSAAYTVCGTMLQWGPPVLLSSPSLSQNTWDNPLRKNKDLFYPTVLEVSVQEQLAQKLEACSIIMTTLHDKEKSSPAKDQKTKRGRKGLASQ